MAENTAIDLITMAEYLAYTGREEGKPGLKKDRLDFIITAASEQVQNEIGREILQATFVDEFDGRNELRRYARRPPITGTPTISYWNRTAWVEATTALWPREITDATGLIRLTSSPFTAGVRWKISYTGGWLQAAVPSAIKMVVCQAVQRAELRATGKEGIRTQGQAEQNTTFDLTQLLTKDLRSRLDPWRVYSR